MSSLSALADGVLLAVFIYWGWDTAVSVNEETRDKARTPGRAAILSTLLLLGIYSLVTVAAQAYSGIGDKGIGLGNPDNAGDVLSVLGHAVFGSSIIGAGLTKLLILMVLSSAAASTLTTILPTARTTLSMAVFQAIPAASSDLPATPHAHLVDRRHGAGLRRVLRGLARLSPRRAR